MGGMRREIDIQILLFWEILKERFLVGGIVF